MVTHGRAQGVFSAEREDVLLGRATGFPVRSPTATATGPQAHRDGLVFYGAPGSRVCRPEGLRISSLLVLCCFVVKKIYQRERAQSIGEDDVVEGESNGGLSSRGRGFFKLWQRCVNSNSW